MSYDERVVTIQPIHRKIKISDGNVLVVILAFLAFGFYFGQIQYGTPKFITYPMLAIGTIYFLIRDKFRLFYSKAKSAVYTRYGLILMPLTLIVCCINKTEILFQTILLDALVTCVSVIFAYYVCRNLCFSRMFWLLTIGVDLFLIVFMATNKTSSHLIGWFENVSNNAISVHVIWLSILLYFSILNGNGIKKINVFMFLCPAVMTLTVCMLAGGRSGLFCSAIVFGTMFLYYFRDGRSVLQKMLFVILGIVLVAFSLDRILQMNFIAKLLESGFSSSVRVDLIREYLASILNPVNLLFGTELGNLNAIKIILQPHNSYVLLHTQFGLLGTGFVLYNLIRSASKMLKRDWCLFALAMAFLLRAFTDSIVFVTNIDFVIYFLMLQRFDVRR